MSTSHDEPGPALISCVLPTYNRRAFLPHAIHYFLQQDYPEKELLVVDDGPDAVGDLIPSHPRIRYVRLPRKVTLGAKLNLCCEQTTGPVIAQWDDDDWYAPDRLSRQMDALLRTGAEVCGASDLLYYELQTGAGHRYVYPPQGKPWLLGSSLFFRRELWERNRFSEIDVGMDGLFVWATPPEKVYSLLEPRFAVHLIHQSNISPKSPQGAWWTPHPVSDIAHVMGDDWCFYEPRGEVLSSPRPRPPEDGPSASESGPCLEVVPRTEPLAASSVRNVYACLVHEARDCVLDLCRNLRHLDPQSAILLYNGGSDPALLGPDPAFQRLGVVVHPSPRPMRWGSLHDFAFDCMRFALAEQPFDLFTVVDSDQLATRAGWTSRLAERLAAAAAEERGPIGLLGNGPERLPPDTDNSAAITAWQEVELWRPFLRRFAGGENSFVHWTFWPGTVITADAAKELVRIYDEDQQLKEILRQSRLWVTEEILFPTLTALLGFRVLESPGSYDYLRFRHAYSQVELDAALDRPDTLWIHPVPRRFENPLRAAVRGRFQQYESTIARPEPSVLASDAFVPAPDVVGPRTFRVNQLREPVLNEMRQVPGWLGDDEANLLITATDQALADCPEAPALVEVGSFRGKGTTVLASVVRAMRPTARVWAVDPHDGVVGARDRGVTHEGPTLESFRANIARAGLEGYVEAVQAAGPAVAWSQPICLLLIDGLHDYGSVAADFNHFAPFLVPSALVAFHDYADYFPGVRTFVDELIRGGLYLRVDQASSLIVLRKVGQASSTAADEPPFAVRLAL
jgi:hypothetical protein